MTSYDEAIEKLSILWAYYEKLMERAIIKIFGYKPETLARAGVGVWLIDISIFPRFKSRNKIPQILSNPPP